MTTTQKKEENPTRESVLTYAEATELFQGMCQIILQIQTMDANSLMIYKTYVEGLKKTIKDNAEIRFLEGVLALVSAATKDSMLDMEHIISDDGTVLEDDYIIKQDMVNTKTCTDPPKKGGMTVTESHRTTKLYLTNDLMTQEVSGKEMACVTTTEGASPIITMDVWGWTDSFPEAYDEEYQIIRPLSHMAGKLWKGERRNIGGVDCGVIKLHLGRRNKKQVEKAKNDLIGNKS